MSNTRKDEPPRDGEISAAYRTRAGETPPAELDARIVAAAHRAVGSRPGGGGRRWFRWIDAPIATAAVVLVSATLVLLMREEGMLGQRAAKEAKQSAGTETTATSAPPVPTATSPAALPAPLRDGAADNVALPAPAAPAESEAKAGLAAPALESQATESAIPEPEAPATMPSEQHVPAAATAPVDAAAEADVPPAEPQRRDAIAPPSPVDREVPAARAGEATGAAESIAPVEERKREASPEAFPGGGAASREAELEQQAVPTTEAPGGAPAMQSAPDATSGVTRSEAPPRAVAPAQGEGAAPAATMDEEAKKSTLSTEKSVGATAPSPEVRWLEEIRTLIRDGKYSDAQLSLARFVKAYPDYRVPADILQALKPAD